MAHFATKMEKVKVLICVPMGQRLALLCWVGKFRKSTAFPTTPMGELGVEDGMILSYVECTYMVFMPEQNPYHMQLTCGALIYLTQDSVLRFGCIMAVPVAIEAVIVHTTR